jgi:hypothetical protein
MTKDQKTIFSKSKPNKKNNLRFDKNKKTERQTYLPPLFPHQSLRFRMTGYNPFRLAMRAIAFDRSIDPFALSFAFQQRRRQLDGELDGGAVALEGVGGGR